MKTLFDIIAPYYDFFNQILTLGSISFYRHLFIKKTKKSIVNQNILEVGCGTGSLIRKILPFKPIKLEALDSSENMLKIARKRFPNLVFYHSDCETFENKVLSYDTCFCAWVLRNFNDQKKALQNIALHLKEGGDFFILESIFPSSFLGKILFFFQEKITLGLIFFCFNRNLTLSYQYYFTSVKQFNKKLDEVEKNFLKHFKIIKKENWCMGFLRFYHLKKFNRPD
jgi:demethylmenaquinone methyltransferase/2-methoxy-6-polyprenyl-1,4-benzoquinol methylase